MALFFSQRKPRGFDYKPRYYDPDKEAREERKRVVLGERYKTPVKEGQAEAEYVPGSFIREHVAARRGASAAKTMQKRRKAQRSVAVLIGMLVVIGLVAWMLYFK